MRDHLVPTASLNGLSQNSLESSLNHTSLTMFKTFSTEVASFNDHNSCSAILCFGGLWALTFTYPRVSNLSRVRPCSSFFPQQGTHCHEWVSAWGIFIEHTISYGLWYGCSRLGPCMQLFMFSALSVPKSSSFPWTQNCHKSFWMHTSLTTFEVLSAEIDTLDDHRLCSAISCFGNLTPMACTLLKASNRLRARPCFIFFPQLWTYCQEWLSA